MALLRARILGCGSSGGVPRLGGRWGACDPDNPRNSRTRCSLLVERIEQGQTTRVLIDTSPDLRAQLLAAEVGELDAVVYTHAHADHVHGIDDLRMVVFNRGSILPVWADADTSRSLKSSFGYVFAQPRGSHYRPILDLNRIDGAFSIDGPGGVIPFQPLPVQHGRIEALGFRCFDLAYMPDVSDVPEAVWPQLDGLDCWILDALRCKPHPTHTHLARSLEWIERAAPRQGVLTNMHNDLDYEIVAAGTPENVTPAHDGLVLEFQI